MRNNVTFDVETMSKWANQCYCAVFIFDGTWIDFFSRAGIFFRKERDFRSGRIGFILRMRPFSACNSAVFHCENTSSAQLSSARRSSAHRHDSEHVIACCASLNGQNNKITRPAARLQKSTGPRNRKAERVAWGVQGANAVTRMFITTNETSWKWNKSPLSIRRIYIQQ